MLELELYLCAYALYVLSATGQTPVLYTNHVCTVKVAKNNCAELRFCSRSVNDAYARLRAFWEYYCIIFLNWGVMSQSPAYRVQNNLSTGSFNCTALFYCCRAVPSFSSFFSPSRKPQNILEQSVVTQVSSAACRQINSEKRIPSLALHRRFGARPKVNN